MSTKGDDKPATRLAYTERDLQRAYRRGVRDGAQRQRDKLRARARTGQLFPRGG